MMGIHPTLGLVAKGTGTNHHAIQSMYYPSTFVGWLTPTMVNGWVSYDGGTTFTTPGYAKGDDNIVRMKGLIRSGVATDGTLITTLPAGYRPREKILLPAICSTGPCQVRITSIGEVTLFTASAAWTSLDHVTFLAEL